MDSRLNSNPFLDRLAEEISQERGALNVVLPNNRSQYLLLKKLGLKEGNDQIRLRTADQLMEELSGLSLIEPDEALISFYSAYRTVESTPQPFEEFSKWAKTFLADVNELDLHLGDIQVIYQQISDYRSVEVADIGPMEAHFRSFWSRLPEYYVSLRSRLVSIKLAYRGLLYRTVADMCNLQDDTIHAAFVGRKTLWVGVVPGNPCESTLIDWIDQHASIELYADVDSHYIDDEIHEAGRLFRQGNVSVENRWKVNLIETMAKEISVWPVAGYTSQLIQAQEILNEIEEDALAKTVVVLTDPSMLTPALNILDAERIGLNVTIKPSLKTSGLHQFVMNLLVLHSSARQRNDSVFFHQKAIERVLSSRLSASWIDGAAVWNKLRPKIVSKNWKFVELNWLREELGKDMFTEQAFHQLFDWNHDVPFAFNRLIEILTEWSDSKHQMRLDRIDALAISGYLKKLKQLSLQYEQVLERSDLKSLRAFLHQHVSYGRFSVNEVNDGVQLMSLLDTRLLDFETVIVIGASDENLPGNPIAATHIPFVHRLHHKLPTTRDSVALTAYHFYRLIQRATNAHLIYNHTSENLNSGEPSRFILQLEDALGDNPKVKWSKKSEQIVLDDKPQELEVLKTAPVLADVKKTLQNKLSPSAINMYLNSPLEFYYYYILRVPEATQVEEDMKASTFGSAVHNVLQSIYESYRGKVVDLRHLKESVYTLDKLVEQEFLTVFDKEDIMRGKNYIQLELAKSYAMRFIQFDILEMERNGPVRILALEDRLENWVEVNGLNVRLFGFADRIDERDGVTRIIDYKTGVVEPAELKCHLDQAFQDSSYSKALQLAFYKWAYAKRHELQSEMVESCIYSFKRSASGYLRLNLQSSEDVFINDFERLVRELIEEILVPSIAFAHRADSKYITF